MAGPVVALWPRYGGLLVAGWLAGIVVDLVTLALTALAWDRDGRRPVSS